MIDRIYIYLLLYITQFCQFAYSCYILLVFTNDQRCMPSNTFKGLSRVTAKINQLTDSQKLD